MNDPIANLNLLDKLILLALDDEKGTFVSNSLVFGYCLAGAALFELSICEKIQVSGNRVQLKDKESIDDEALDFCLEMIAKSKKERKVNYWIESIGNKEKSLRTNTLNKLISLGILAKKEDKILWIFTNNKYPSKNDKPENALRKQLHEIVINDSHADFDEIMIVSLVDACGLNREVYGKEIAKKQKKKIKKLIKEFEFAEDTGKVIQEIHETIMAVLIIMITTTTVTTTVS